MSYCDNPDNGLFSANIDFSDITEDTMTDTGVPVEDLEAIETCVLSPGHPSPIGRTEDGDLAYPIYEGYDYVYLKRREAAELAYIYAKAHGLTEVPTDLKDPTNRLLHRLLSEAVPEVLFDESNHQQLAYKAALQAVFNGDWHNYPARFK